MPLHYVRFCTPWHCSRLTSHPKGSRPAGTTCPHHSISREVGWWCPSTLHATTVSPGWFPLHGFPFSKRKRDPLPKTENTVYPSLAPNILFQQGSWAVMLDRTACGHCLRQGSAPCTQPHTLHTRCGEFWVPFQCISLSHHMWCDSKWSGLKFTTACVGCFLPEQLPRMLLALLFLVLSVLVFCLPAVDWLTHFVAPSQPSLGAPKACALTTTQVVP